MNIKCFLIDATDREKQWLRRYHSSSDDSKRCPGRFSYHNGHFLLGEFPVGSERIDFSHDDPRWPVKCDDCDYHFTVEDEWQLFHERLWKRTDTGEEMILRDAPAGAMWNADWFSDCPEWCGPDGKCYIVRMPCDHEWQIDGRASNCDSPCANCGRPYHQHQSQTCPQGYKDARPHKCWIRHGTAPVLTVDKNGTTCGAGAGSILVPGWHGFLRNGILEQC